MPLKILVVDDHADTRAICRELFTHFGYEVLEAVDGIQGVDVARREIPDLILLDFLMPRADGQHTLAELRDDPRLTHTKVILFTAAATELESLLKLEGVHSVLLKPIESRRLLEVVRMVVGGPENSSLGLNPSS